MANVKLSDIASGGAVAGATDKVVTVRSGTTDLLTTPVALDIAQAWAALQTFANSMIALLGSSTGKTTFVSDNAGASDFNMHVPAANDTLAAIAAAQTLTHKTLTDFINTGVKRSSAQLDKATSTAFTSITGLAVALTAGATYKIKAHLPCTSGASGGVKACIATSDTLTLTSSDLTGYINNTAVAPVIVHTTSGLTTALGSTQVAESVIIEGTLIVNAAGTLVIQGSQNASDAATTSFYVGGYLEVARIA